MKKIVALLAIFAALQVRISTAQAQQGFDMKPLGLINSQLKGKQPLRFGQSRAAAIKALGTPTNQGKEYFEMDRATAVVLYYHANVLYFVKDQLDCFELNDNTLALGRSSDQAFRVGSALKANARQTAAGNVASGARYRVGNIPLVDLRVDTKPGKSGNLNYKTIAYNNTRWGSQECDEWIEILFDANNKIIKIATGSM